MKHDFCVQETKRFWFWFCFCSVFILISGCHKKTKLEGLVPVRGVLTFQGQGLDGAIITFSPKEYKQGNRAAVAVTDENGRFELATLGEKGVQPNVYRVSIVKNIAEDMENSKKTIPRMPSQRPKAVSIIPQRYNHEKKSGIEFLIDQNGVSDLLIELENR